MLCENGTQWYRSNHTLEPYNDILLIVPDPNSDIEYYSPLFFQLQDKQPQSPGNQDELSPAIAAANLKLSDLQALVDFTNKWGLLGLSNVQDYADKLADNNDWGEPVHLFNDAISCYQKIVMKIVEQQNRWPDTGSYIAESLNNHLKHSWMGIKPSSTDVEYVKEWHFNSLLSAMYLHVSDILLAKKIFQRCKRDRCRKIFVSDNNDNVYCSVKCRSAHLTFVSRKHQWKRDALINAKNYLAIMKITEEEKARIIQLLDQDIDTLLEQAGVGKKRLGSKIMERIKAELPFKI